MDTFPVLPAACSARFYITLPKVCNDLLIWLAYLSLSLSLMPVLAILELPAKSTKLSILDFLFIFLGKLKITVKWWIIFV